MSNMCLVVTPSIRTLADKIRQEYPEASTRNGFSDQMCAEWIGLYNNTNSKNPDFVPPMKSLVNFIEKLRNNEGKSFLRDLKAEEKQRAIEQEMQDIKAKAIADGTFMKAPNGKDTNLTERQWLQVRTKAFKKWFGDWEKLAPKSDATEKLISKLDNIANSDSRYAALAKLILDNNALPYNLKYFKIDDNRDDIEGHAGMWHSVVNLIEVLGNNVSEEEINKALLHELIHYNTEELLTAYKNSPESVPQNIRQNVTELYSIIDYAKKYIIEHFNEKKFREIAERQNKNIGSRVFYAFDNQGDVEIDEFISEIFTNPGLQEILNEIPYKETKQTLWDRIKECIHSIFGIPINRGSVLEEALKASTEFITKAKEKYDSVSKVVDENGEPLVVYHHTDDPNLNEFSTDFENYFAKDGGTKEAIFFDEEKTGTLNRKYDLPVFLNIRELNEYNETKQQLHDRGTTYREVVNESARKNNKTGGVHMKDFDDNKKEHQSIWIIHNSNQVKSAIDNNGDFSIENNSILASPQAYEEIPVEALGEIADEDASTTAYDSLESSDPDLNKKFGGKTEATVSELLDNLLANNTPFEDFVKALKENIGELGNIQVKLVPNSYPAVHNLAGVYVKFENTIYINRNVTFQSKDGKADNTILHEIVHAIVANSLNTAKHREELNTIFEEAREKILKKYNVSSFEELPENLRRGRLYGLQNLDEFSAEFFTNSEFISELNDESTFGKRSDKKSIISRLVEWIKSLLPKGVTETYKRSGEILEDILLNSGGTIQAFNNRNLLSVGNSSAAAQSAFNRLSTPESPLQVYSDGSDFKGTGKIGYGSVFEYSGRQYGISGTEENDEVKNLQKQFPDAKFSNPTMEMLALATTLEHFASMGNGENIIINQDYKGACNYQGLWEYSEGSAQRDPKAWKAKEPYIKYLVDRSVAAIEKIKQDGGSVKINWVKGHQTAGTEQARMNDAADKYAKSRDNSNNINDAYVSQQPQNNQQQPRSTVSTLFKQGIETLAGYYEGGGRLITDDFPGVPKELDDKLDNHFMGGEELSDADYYELNKYVGVIKNPEPNVIGAPYIAVPKGKMNKWSNQQQHGSVNGSSTATQQNKIQITESTGSYAQRTRENAEWSDITLALAIDFNTYGEIATKKAAGNKYISSTLPSNGRPNAENIEIDAASYYAKEVFKELQKKNKTVNIKLNIAGNGIYTFAKNNFATQEELNQYVYNLLSELQKLGATISEIRSGGQTGIDEAGIIAAQRLGIPASIHAPRGFLFRTAEGKDVANKEAFESRFISSSSQVTTASTPSSPSQSTTTSEISSTPKERPHSDAFESALKVTENRITQFYQTFTPQQIKDRGTLIADYFSDIIDDYINDEQDRLLDIIEDDNATAEEKEEARVLRNLLRDPINGRQYAANKIQIGNIIDQIKKKIKRNVDKQEGTKKQLWQNTYDFFEELFNNQASLEIEEQEGIRIVGLRFAEKSAEEIAKDEQSDGNDDTGHTVRGNDGWIFQTRFENPAESLSKKVRRMLYNIKRSSRDVDDLGHRRKYSSGQIYATLLSYLAKNMQDPDAFMQVTQPDDYTDDMKDHYGNKVTKQLYRYGYPTFPVLEKMREQYPWVEQIINRLTDDYLDAEWNTCIAYPSTYGAMASQFYTNFRKVFIPYAKIQLGDDKFGVTPLNIEMASRCQFDKLSANFNNGIVLTDTSIYNQDTTINREHAKELKDTIAEFIADNNIGNMYLIYQDFSDKSSIKSQEDEEAYKEFLETARFILNSFGISSQQDNIVALLAQTEDGNTLLDMMKDLYYIADTISNVSDENASQFNYLIDTQYVGGEKVWNKFFEGRGMITDESYMQSFYDSASKKTRYSYSADNYLQKTFRGVYNPDINERRKFIDEKFKKYEWFYNHKTNTWRNKWLEKLYNAQDITDVLPYKNINNITSYGKTVKVRDYTEWTPDDIWQVQNRSYGQDNNPYTFYLAPIFSDSPMSMTVMGPRLGREEVVDALVSLIDQELWRIYYVQKREEAIKAGRVKEIANFDGKRGKEFCFIPELNAYKFEDGKTLLEKLQDMKKGTKADGSSYTAEEIQATKVQAIYDVLVQKAREYMMENQEHYLGKDFDPDTFLTDYMNMTYANASIIQLTTIDLAFYKSDVDFQKRFKEVYAGGIQLNTNSRYGEKTENVILIANDIITSPSYTAIADNINRRKNLTEKDKEHILGTFTDINVADAQAIRAMHSFRSVMDMMGRWGEREEKALEHFKNGTWSREDFDVIYQTIKPFVYTVIDRNDGFGGVIPVPQQHKNSEICALMMYDLITNDLKSPVYSALSRFMETKGADGKYLIQMAQYESAGKVGNQGVVNISCNPDNVMKAISKKWDAKKDRDNVIKEILDKYDFDTAKKEIDGKEVYLPNDEDNAVENFKAIKKQLDRKLDNKTISQEDYNKIIAYLRPTEEEIISILDQKVLITNEDGSKSINPEFVHTIPFDNYYQAQPTPEHHIDAEAVFGSQARNIAPADLPDDFELTLKIKGGKTITLKGKDAVIDFYYELIDENLIEDFFGDGKTKGGLKEVFSSKDKLFEAVSEIVRGNPKYGKDFIDALRTDEDGNFVLSPNSPTMFTLMQELITSLFKNRITKQTINGASLIQAAGIGLDDKLRLVKDEKGNIVGAQCLMPLTSKRFFEPFIEKKIVNGKEVMYLDPHKLEDAGLREAVGYRIPTENKSSMLPLIIEGFTPLQNGSCIILPAEITALAGSDFDVDKMFIMLLSFYIQNYNMQKARENWADKEYLTTEVFSNPDLSDNISDEDPEDFRKWFSKHKDKYLLDKPVAKVIEYDFSKSPKENGRKARNNMLIQIIFGILTSDAGNGSLLNPQGFDNLKAAAKLNRIISDPTLKKKLMENYTKGITSAVPSAEQIKTMFLDKYKDMNPERLAEMKKSLNNLPDSVLIDMYIETAVMNNPEMMDVIDVLLSSSLKDREKFVKDYSAPESPIYPQTFAHSHARNMAGNIQIGIYAVQASMCAKYQRAHIVLRKNHQFKINGRTIQNVDVSDNGKRLKNCGEMVGGSADNGKDPNLSDAGSTSKTAPIIGYMLRLGLTHEEAVLIINQPVMKSYSYNPDAMEVAGFKKIVPGEVDTKMLLKSIMSPFSLSAIEQNAIDAMCYRILKQAKAMEGLTMISRADSPNGAMQNSFAKARVQQYMVDLFNAQMGQEDFPFYPIKEVINNNLIDVRKGEDDVREKLKSQPMALLHAMYALGINSLNELGSPYFFMLSKEFDDTIVKPLLYNKSKAYKQELEELVDKIYLQYITFVLSSSPLFGDETNDDGSTVSMKDKRDYYLNHFADDYAKTIQENEQIRNLIGTILKRDSYNPKKIVLQDIGSLDKRQKDVISRRFDALIALGDEGMKMAKNLLLYAYYDSGLNFSHDSYSTRLSTYFLSQFDAFRTVLQQLDEALPEEQKENFKHQFLMNNRNVAFKADAYVDEDSDLFDDGAILKIDMTDYSTFKVFTNVILSPNPRMEGIHPYSYISLNGYVYVLDEEAWAKNPGQAIYNKLAWYPTDSNRPMYNANKSVTQLSDEYKASKLAQQSQNTPAEEQDVDNFHNDSDDSNLEINNISDLPTTDDGEDNYEIDISGITNSATPAGAYDDEETLKDPFCGIND